MTPLLHLTDPPLFADPAGEVYGVNTRASLARVLQHALTHAPDALLGLLGRFANVRGVVSGHVHQAFELDTRPPGYRWLQLAPDGRLGSAVAWLDDGTARP